MADFRSLMPEKTLVLSFFKLIERLRFAVFFIGLAQSHCHKITMRDGMKNKLALLTLLLASLSVLGGCANAPEFSKTVVKKENVHQINSVMAYSFLDFREDYLGPKMLEQINQQLKMAFSGRSIDIQLMLFKDSKAYESFTITEDSNVPIGSVLNEGYAKEREMGASHRLIVFPKKVVSSGAWVFYNLSLSLYDLNSNALVWSTTLNGKHVNTMTADEVPEARAKLIVSGIFNELNKSGLLPVN